MAVRSPVDFSLVLRSWVGEGRPHGFLNLGPDAALLWAEPGPAACPSSSGKLSGIVERNFSSTAEDSPASQFCTERPGHLPRVTQLKSGSQVMHAGSLALGPVFPAPASLPTSHHTFPSCPSPKSFLVWPSSPSLLSPAPCLLTCVPLRATFSDSPCLALEDSSLCSSLDPASGQPYLFQCFPQRPDTCLVSVKNTHTQKKR